MVYCTNCGTKNPDNAKHCSKCGEPLTTGRHGYDDDCFGFRDLKQEPCFGIPNIIWPLVIGGLIIIWGLSILFDGYFAFLGHNMWALIFIVIGLIIIGRALQRYR
jgi:uncharacterized membrane protein YvbJ